MDVGIRLGASTAPPGHGPVVRPSLPVESQALAPDAWVPSPPPHEGPDPLRQLGTAVAIALVAVTPLPGIAQALEDPDGEVGTSRATTARPAPPPPVVLVTLDEGLAPEAAPAVLPTVPADPVTPTTPAVGASRRADDQRSYDVPWPVQERTFGHARVGGQLFDASGNWADTGTAVTADQAAAMPQAQRAALAARAGVAELRLGDAERALLRPAAGTMQPGQVVDTGRSLTTPPRNGLRNFGHDPVHGRLFQGNAWADDGNLVSADQAAAMPEAQRHSLARSAGVAVGELRLGDAARVLDEPAPPRPSPFDGVPAGRIVTSDGFRMRADTARAYHRLKGLIAEEFPGRPVRITSTMGGRHADPGHREGRSVDFVVEPLTNQESRTVEALAWKAGFRPYNEYVHDSPYKTGPHMHVTLPKGS